MTTAEALQDLGGWSEHTSSEDSRLADIVHEGQIDEPAKAGFREFVAGIKEELSQRERLAVAVGALGIIGAAGVVTGRKVFSS